SSPGRPPAMLPGPTQAGWRRCAEAMALTRLAPEAVSSAVAIREVTTLVDFDAMQTDWNQLVDQLEVPSPFQTWEWNRAWWNHFGVGRALLILVFRLAGWVIGFAPFLRCRSLMAVLGL